MSTHTSTKRGHARVVPADPESLVRFAELLKLRSLARTTQEEYLRYVRKLAARVGGDPAGIDEAQLRAHLLYLKDAHNYSPSSMRSAVAAMRAYFGLSLGRDWKLFDLVRSPSALTLPLVPTREEIVRLFAVVREDRFLTMLRLIYACGLRISEAARLEVADLRGGERVHVREAKGQKERYARFPSGQRLARAHASRPQGRSYSTAFADSDGPTTPFRPLAPQL